MSAEKGLRFALGEAIATLESLGDVREKSNGWKNLSEVFAEFGKFAEDGLDEVLSYLEEARSYAQELIEENERLKERLAMDVQEEEGERCASYDCI